MIPVSRGSVNSVRLEKLCLSPSLQTSPSDLNSTAIPVTAFHKLPPACPDGSLLSGLQDAPAGRCAFKEEGCGAGRGGSSAGRPGCPPPPGRGAEAVPLSLRSYAAPAAPGPAAAVGRPAQPAPGRRAPAPPGLRPAPRLGRPQPAAAAAAAGAAIRRRHFHRGEWACGAVSGSKVLPAVRGSAAAAPALGGRGLAGEESGSKRWSKCKLSWPGSVSQLLGVPSRSGVRPSCSDPR